MAAKQGISAQISQASEDAKRAVLSHAGPLKSSWFSNLNTTCTIKSAPPRTPEVLSLLSQKSGWLWKRNEQHVWQARWCCVVPHTFLYYFDSSASSAKPPPLTQKQQDALNDAVKSGYGDKPHSGPRYSVNVFSPDQKEGDPPSNSMFDKSPAGIIDLECYTSVHRSSENALLLELAGDDAVNPDLRSFYFYSEDEADSVDWTQALLHNRHGALEDELEAFREVASGFAQQLQELHADLDEAVEKKEQVEAECYSVRSQMEEMRRTCFRILREALEEKETTTTRSPLSEARQAYRQDLETAREMGLVPAVQLLSDYVRVLEEQCVVRLEENQELQTRLQQSQDLDVHKKQSLERTIFVQQQEWIQEKRALETQVASLEQTLRASQKQTETAQQEAASQKLEMQMYQNSTKQRLGELLTHKKILKKEVIGLRKKLDEVGSELSLLKHTTKTSLENVEQERRKSELLEKYVERMESQVKVQQNMMEFMSTQSGSVQQHALNGNQSQQSSYIGAAGASGVYSHEIQKEHNQLLERARAMVEQEEKNVLVESDEKSHMSELTEDRTQKQFDAAFDSSPLLSRHQRGTSTRKLPSYIGVQEEEDDDDDDDDGVVVQNAADDDNRLETIMSAASLPPRRKQQQHSAAAEVVVSGAASTGKLSVAQRARLEADERVSTTVRARAPPQVHHHHKKSLLTNLGKSITDAIDHSIGGSSVSSGGSTTSSGERRRYGNHSDAGVSSVQSSMSLQERQSMQRAKQLAFLKEQGLIKEESNLRGGAGAPTLPRRY